MHTTFVFESDLLQHENIMNISVYCKAIQRGKSLLHLLPSQESKNNTGRETVSVRLFTPGESQVHSGVSYAMRPGDKEHKEEQ